MSSPTQAVDNASRLSDLGFAEFTAKLISDVFDAIVSSNIRQQEAYAELLERVSMSAAEFEGEAVADADIAEYLAENFPGASGSTSLVDGHEVTADEEAKLSRLFDAQATELELQLPAAGDTLAQSDVDDIEAMTRRKLATRRLDALRELVESGVVRTVVETGRIETRLDFTTSGRDTSREYQRDTSSSNLGGSVNAGFVGKLFGINGSIGGSRVKTSTHTRSNTAYTSAKVETGGTVELNLRSDYVPLRLSEE